MTNTEVSKHACPNDGMKYAFYLLARQNYTVFKLGKKLEEKGYSDCKQEIIDSLKEKGLLNDTLYATRFIEGKDETNPYGAFVLRRKLKEKGIHPDLVERVLQTMERDENQLALQIAMKKFRHAEPDKEKVLRFLASRGFSYDSSLSAWHNYASDQQDCRHKCEPDSSLDSFLASCNAPNA